MNDPSVIENDPLVIENITSGYGHVTVLRDVSLRVGQGEIVALLGSNGAGKSTLLKTVVGLLHPSKGQILVDGANVASTATERIAEKGVVLCPEGRQLFGALSVQDNLMLGAYGHRREAADVDASARWLDRSRGRARRWTCTQVRPSHRDHATPGPGAALENSFRTFPSAGCLMPTSVCNAGEESPKVSRTWGLVSIS